MCAATCDPPDKTKLPIIVHVGYAWPQRRAKRKAEDHVWRFIRKLIGTTTDALAKVQANRAAPKLPVRINRLRAMHGGSVLDVLLRRISRSDILVFDITGQNPDVLIEIGMALACKGTAGSVFILQKADAKGNPVKTAAHPSDLSGYFFTRYQENALPGRSSFRLIEAQGFAAALRSRIIDAARERGIWRDAQRTISDESEIDEGRKPRTSAARRASREKSRPAAKETSRKKRTKRKL